MLTAVVTEVAELVAEITGEDVLDADEAAEAAYCAFPASGTTADEDDTALLETLVVVDEDATALVETMTVVEEDGTAEVEATAVVDEEATADVETMAVVDEDTTAVVVDIAAEDDTTPVTSLAPRIPPAESA